MNNEVPGTLDGDQELGCRVSRKDPPRFATDIQTGCRPGILAEIADCMAGTARNATKLTLPFVPRIVVPGELREDDQGVRDGEYKAHLL